MLKKYKDVLIIGAGLAVNFIGSVTLGIGNTNKGYNGQFKSISEFLFFDVIILFIAFLISTAYSIKRSRNNK